MTDRFPGLVIQDWRTRLVHDHPALFPDARLVDLSDGPALTASGWPSVPDGWRHIIEVLCRRLDAAASDTLDRAVTVVDMKEKWGQLQVSISMYGLDEEAGATATYAVDLAEARSAHVCELCGRPGRLSVRAGWYATRCESDAFGFVPLRPRGRDVEVSSRFVDGRLVRSGRRYLPAADAFVPVPVPDED